MNEGMMNVLSLVPIMLFALCFHEFAHAWVANRLGDKTAEENGRLSFHPLAHADMVGTFLLPIICIYNGWPAFGWAKPVPVDARNFKNPRRGMALVAAAGPVSNLMLAGFATGLLAILVRVPADARVIETLQLFSVIGIQVNLILAFFNLLPVPPLDGFNVVQAFVPAKVAVKLYRLAPLANLLLIVMLFTGGFRIISVPALYCYKFLVTLAT